MGRPVLPIAPVTSTSAVAIYSSGGAPPLPPAVRAAGARVRRPQPAAGRGVAAGHGRADAVPGVRRPGPVPGLDPEQLAEWTQARGATATPDRAGTALAI